MREIYERVGQFNSNIGNKRTGLMADAESQFVLIREEFKEVGQAIEAEDFLNLRKELADFIVTAYGVSHRMGFPYAESEAMIPRPVSEDYLWSAAEDGERMLLGNVSAMGMAISLCEPVALESAINKSIDSARLIAGSLNIPLVDDLNAVCDSNESKFCQNLREAMKTKSAFMERGIDVVISGVGGLFAVKPARPQTVDGKYYPSGKLLKSINYKEAVIL